jgi:type I restriction enzyme M protein
MHKDTEDPYIIFEVKKSKRKDGLQQLKSYCNAEGSPIRVWSNGEELVIVQEPNCFTQISAIPTSESS